MRATGTNSLVAARISRLRVAPNQSQASDGAPSPAPNPLVAAAAAAEPATLKGLRGVTNVVKTAKFLAAKSSPPAGALNHPAADGGSAGASMLIEQATRKTSDLQARLTKRASHLMVDTEDERSSEVSGDRASGKKHTELDEGQVSFQTEAAFLYVLGLLALVALVLMPVRIAFSPGAHDSNEIRPIDGIAWAADAGFVALYSFGVSTVRKGKKRRQRALELVLGESQVEKTSWQDISHPFQIMTQVVLGSLVPLVCDIVGELIVVTGSGSGGSQYADEFPRLHPLLWVGVLRLLHILQKAQLFEGLYRNLVLPLFSNLIIQRVRRSPRMRACRDQ